MPDKGRREDASFSLLPVDFVICDTYCIIITRTSSSPTDGLVGSVFHVISNGDLDTFKHDKTKKLAGRKAHGRRRCLRPAKELFEA